MADLSPDEALAELLLSLFSADELRRFLRYGPQGDRVERMLPGPTASAAAVVDTAVDALRRVGLLDQEFFDRLVAERDRRADVINAVRQLVVIPPNVLSAAPPAFVTQPATSPKSGAPVTQPAKIFVSYSHEDEGHRRTLDKSLSVLKRQGVVSVWHDRQIQADDEWKGTIDRNLEDAEIILLLVSMDFLASDYCWDVEMKRAMERHDAGSARVIPIFVRACDWSGAPFARLQGVPDPKIPIEEYRSRDSAWTEVARAIRDAAYTVGAQHPQPIDNREIEGHGEDQTPIGEIFARGTEPTATFVPSAHLSQIRAYLRSMGAGLVVQGPSGIGKTTAVRRALADVGTGRKVHWFHGQKSGDVEDIRRLLQSGFSGFLIVDDFHYLPADACRAVADGMKVLADRNGSRSKIVAVGINPIGSTLLVGRPDLAGRYDEVSMSREPNERVEELITKGELAANVRFKQKLDLVREAQGSFFTAQQMCFQACLLSGREERLPDVAVVDVETRQVVAAVMRAVKGKYLPGLSEFASRDGDTEPRGACLALLYLLGTDVDDMVGLDEAARRYPSHRVPLWWLRDQGLGDAFATIPGLDRLLHYNPVAKVLAAEDPQLSFFLRNLDWPGFARKTGHPGVAFDLREGIVFPRAAAVTIEAANSGEAGRNTQVEAKGVDHDNANRRAPVAFLSYSWDSTEHKTWVKHLAGRLRADGVDVILDQWEVSLGDQLPQFMETAVRESDYVVMVCTPGYKEKADGRRGGVGYEGHIISAAAYTSGEQRKFVPVLRTGTWTNAAPSFLLGKAYANLVGEPYSDEAYATLLAHLHDDREAPPPVGTYRPRHKTGDPP